MFAKPSIFLSIWKMQWRKNQVKIRLPKQFVSRSGRLINYQIKKNDIYFGKEIYDFSYPIENHNIVHTNTRIDYIMCNIDKMIIMIIRSKVSHLHCFHYFENYTLFDICIISSKPLQNIHFLWFNAWMNLIWNKKKLLQMPIKLLINF